MASRDKYYWYVFDEDVDAGYKLLFTSLPYEYKSTKYSFILVDDRSVVVDVAYDDDDINGHVGIVYESWLD